MVILMTLWADQQQNQRTVLIFAGNADNVNVVKQLNIIKADAKGIADRNMIFKVITNTAANAAQYNKWHVTPAGGFTVLLIGKDGGEKLRSHQPVTLGKFFSLIDAMPMRQDEMRANTNN